MDISEVAERARTFAKTLERTKAELAPKDYWYPFAPISNIFHLENLLTGKYRDLHRLADGKPTADIGGADGDCAFFLETLGFKVQLIDKDRGHLERSRMLKKALSSSVEITKADLDTEFALPEREYGIVLMLGVLYHLKNPFHVLETLSRQTRYLFLSTRVARFSPGGVPLYDIPVAYLVDGRELNNDPSNTWVFSHTGLRRLLARTGWAICCETTRGDTAGSDPVSTEKDERAFLLLESRGS